MKLMQLSDASIHVFDIEGRTVRLVISTNGLQRKKGILECNGVVKPNQIMELVNILECKIYRLQADGKEYTVSFEAVSILKGPYTAHVSYLNTHTITYENVDVQNLKKAKDILKANLHRFNHEL